MSARAPARLPRGRHRLSRADIVRSQRRRLLEAAARVTAERGYEATTVADILAAAGVGRESFYEIFSDRRDCVLAAHQGLLDDLIAKVAAAYAGKGAWVERCRATLAVLLDWFAADPAGGRFLLIELAAIGPEFHARFEAGFDRFVAIIDSGLPPDLPDPGPLPTTSLAVAAAISRVYGEVAADRSTELPALLPRLTYEVLVPFLGEEAAAAAAFPVVERE
ncbi:MAG TPA: helix-turn-helix domain-containing protein [Solirubrobacterales bacterium]|nr:helix-turn-helix domain-containing protein [Solirubrobacterales bacterium]